MWRPALIDTDAAAIAYLRNDAGFEGVIVAPIGALADERGEDEEHLAIACVVAGCDLLLGAEDTADVVRALRHAQEGGAFDAEMVRAACHRIDARAEWASVARAGREATLEDAMWARRMADAAVHVQRGRIHALVSPVDVIVVDDDPHRVERAGTALREILARLDVEVREVSEPSGDSRGSVVIALVGDRRIALGFETFSDGALTRVRNACARAQQSARDVIAVHFTPPDFGQALDDVPTVVCGWSGTRAMEEAVARRLARGG